MSEQTSYIASLCSKLAQQGKQPSVALIRKLANRPLPLPLIISVLKKWKENPELVTATIEDEVLSPQTEISDPQRISALEIRVQELESKLNYLTCQLETLFHSRS